MPGTPVQLGSTAVATGASSVTTGTLSPSANALLIAVGANTNADSEEITSTFDANLLDWTNGEKWRILNNEESQITNPVNTGYGSDGEVTNIWVARTNSSPGTGTVTANAQNGVVCLKLAVLEITTDVPLADPIVQFHFSGAASGTGATDDLTYAPASTSMLISVGMGNDSTAATTSADTGWTELGTDTTQSRPFNFQYRTGTTSTQYGIGFSETMANGIAIGCIEIREDITLVEPPSVLGQFNFTSSSATHTHPASDITVAADSWIFIGTAMQNAGGERSVTGITSTFDIQGSWTKAGNSTVVGSSNVKTEWWYAQAASSGDLTGTVTVTWNSAASAVGCVMLQIDDPAVTGIGQTAEATTSSLTGNTALTGTFGTSPAAGSRILAMGTSSTVTSQNHVEPRMGWTYIGPPANEGFSLNQFSIHRVAGDDTFGGIFSSSAETGGACWFAVEVLGNQANTLVADSGAFTLTGADAGIYRRASLQAESGQFIVTGTAADLLQGAHIDAETAAYALSGTDAALIGPTFTLTAESGAFTKSGTDVALVKASILPGESGTYVLTGEDVNIFTDVQLVAESGAFTLSGTAAGLYWGHYFLAEMGTIQMSAPDVTLATGTRLSADSGSYALTGTDIDFLRSYPVLAAESGTFTLSGTATTLAFGGYLPADSGAFTLTGSDVSLSATGNFAIVAEAGAFIVTGADVTLDLGRVLDAESGTYAWTGSTVTLTYAPAGQVLLAIRNEVNKDVFSAGFKTGKFRVK